MFSLKFVSLLISSICYFVNIKRVEEIYKLVAFRRSHRWTMHETWAKWIDWLNPKHIASEYICLQNMSTLQLKERQPYEFLPKYVQFSFSLFSYHLLRNLVRLCNLKYKRSIALILFTIIYQKCNKESNSPDAIVAKTIWGSTLIVRNSLLFSLIFLFQFIRNSCSTLLVNVSTWSIYS